MKRLRIMFDHELRALERIRKQLEILLGEGLISVVAFGSRVRKDHSEESDFDLLVVVRGKTPEVEREVIGIIVDVETDCGLSFSPVVKDLLGFQEEERLHSPFYQRIITEGVSL
jgi:predicted nucleotidyltransferase